VKRLRRKLRDAGGSLTIETVRSVGYRLVKP
jgi:DNA-binding response OmpR family regulator